MKFADLDPNVLAPKPMPGLSPNDHFVELYEGDESLIDSLHRYVAVGVGDEETVIVIATQAHQAALDERLSRTIDVESAKARGIYKTFDAAELLATFMEGDDVDQEKFEAAIGSLLEKVSVDGASVRLFGEMVVVLWERGLVAAALKLEDFWNALAEKRRFKLFCAYPGKLFGDMNTSPIKAVCDRHSHVLVAG
jgi:hypothetical protein